MPWKYQKKDVYFRSVLCKQWCSAAYLLYPDCTLRLTVTDRACCRRVAAISSTTALRWPTPTAKWSRTRSTESRTKLTSSSPTPPSRVCTLFMCVSGSCVARLRLTVRQLSHWPIHVNGSLVVTSRLKQHDMWWIVNTSMYMRAASASINRHSWHHLKVCVDGMVQSTVILVENCY